MDVILERYMWWAGGSEEDSEDQVKSKCETREANPKTFGGKKVKVIKTLW